MRKGCPLSPLLFNIVAEILAKAIRQEKERKRIPIGKEEVRFSLFCRWHDLCLEDPFSRVVGHQTNTQKSGACMYISNKQERSQENNPIHNSPQKYIGISD
jgi:hypothetical protein